MWRISGTGAPGLTWFRQHGFGLTYRSTPHPRASTPIEGLAMANINVTHADMEDAATPTRAGQTGIRSKLSELITGAEVLRGTDGELAKTFNG